MISTHLILLALATLGLGATTNFPPIKPPPPPPLPPIHFPPPPPPPPVHPSPPVHPPPPPSHPSTPTHSPTSSPTHSPTSSPTHSPTSSPTHSPTSSPTSSATSSTPSPSQTITFNAMHMNIKFDSMPDNLSIQDSINALAAKQNISTPASYYPNTGERPWSQRRVPLVRMMQRRNVQLAGVVEALVRQVNDIQTLLGPDFAHVGVGRDDNTTDNSFDFPDNEFGPLYWNTSLFKLRDFDTFWLSDMPFDVGTKAPQAGNPRICTTAHLDTPAGLITVMETHWDDQTDAGREVGASLIFQRANFEAFTTKRPVLLFGDFNSVAVNLTTPGCNSCTNGAYLIITGAAPPLAINATFLERFPVPDNAKNFSMVDLKTVTPGDQQYGCYATFTGFDKFGDTPDMKKIDFIMGGSNGGWIPENYGVPNSLTDDGLYLSDHRAVMAELTILPGSFPVELSSPPA